MKRQLTLFFKRFPAYSFAGTFFIFILIEGLFSFCTKTTCPDFSNAAYDSWFPYESNQALYFKTATGEPDTITIASTYRSDQHTTYGGAANCNSWANISSYVTNTTPRLYIYMNQYSDGNALSIQLNDFSITEARLSDDNITVTAIGDSSFLRSSAVIAGKTFNNVVQLQKDTALIKTAGVYKVWIAKGAGLVGYENYPTLEQWAKE